MRTSDKLLQNDGVHVYAEGDCIENRFPFLFGEEYVSARNAETELLQFAERAIKEGTSRWEMFGQYDNHFEGAPCAPKYAGEIKFKVFDGDTLVIYGEGVMPDFTFQIDINGWELNSSIKERKITRLAICGNIKEIGNRNFLGFEKLKTVVLPSTLKTIGMGAFCRCDSLVHIALPEGLEYIGEKAFYNAALTQVYIPESVKTVGEKAFYCGLIVNRKSIPTLKTMLISQNRNFDLNEVFKMREKANEKISKEKDKARIYVDWDCNTMLSS